MIEKLVLDALKEACARAGNQLELANQCGVSQGQISDYLCGRRQIRNMTLGTLEKLFPELVLTFFHDQGGSAADRALSGRFSAGNQKRSRPGKDYGIY